MEDNNDSNVGLHHNWRAWLSDCTVIVDVACLVCVV